MEEREKFEKENAKKNEEISKLRKNIEGLEDMVNCQKEEINNLKKSDLELSYFKSNNLSNINSVILNNQLLTKKIRQKYLSFRNQRKNRKRK